MDIWLLYLLVTASVGFLLLWSLLLTRRRAWKLLLAVFVGVLLVAGIPTPILHHQHVKDVEEWQLLQAAYTEQYPDDQLVRIDRPEYVYVFYRLGSETVKVSMLIGDFWVELGELQAEVPSE